MTVYTIRVRGRKFRVKAPSRSAAVQKVAPNPFSEHVVAVIQVDGRLVRFVGARADVAKKVAEVLGSSI